MNKDGKTIKIKELITHKARKMLLLLGGREQCTEGFGVAAIFYFLNIVVLYNLSVC